MWKTWLTTAIAVLSLALGVACQTPEAAFHFVEGNTVATVQAGERKVISLDTANGPTQFEMALLPVNRTDAGIVKHWQVYGRNLGGYGQLQSPDHAVHPLGIVVRFQNTGVTGPLNRTFDRNNQFLAHVNAGGKTYGLRDAWLQEPTRLQTSTADGGTILFWVLDGRAPPNGFPPYYGLYQNSFNGHPTEDPLSANHHRWKGGFMKMWDIIITTEDRWDLIEMDPMPENVPDHWYNLVRHARPGLRTPYPDRVQQVMDSLDKFGWDEATRSLRDPPGDHGLLWWIFQAENRFRYWQASDFHANIGQLSHQVGWKDWLCLKWQEGHYNNGYNWLSVVFRRWLDTRSAVSWWILTRMARWEASSGLVWTSHIDTTNGTFTPDARFGSDWYEKGTRGWEVGSDYWPSSYKNYSEQVLLANMLLKTGWSHEAVEAHKGYILNRAGYPAWSGMYGMRIPGWGIMNAMAFYRFTSDPQWITFAKSVADNAITYMRNPARMAKEHDPQWRDPVLGLPYIANFGANGKREFSPWALSKLAIGLVELSAYGHVPDYDAKIRQMAEFLVLECQHSSGPWRFGISRQTYDRVPAQYYGGHGSGASGWPVSTASMDWHIWPIAYAATWLNSDVCANVFEGLVNQMGSLLDWPVPIQPVFYEIGSGSKAGSVVTISGIDLTGVHIRHNLRLEDSGGRVFFFHIDSIDGNDLTVTQFWASDQTTAPAGDYTATIVGPMGEDRPNPAFFVRDTDDRAIRSFNFDTSNPPSMSRPFDWSNGRHFNNWQKMVMQPLAQGAGPYIALKVFLHNRQERGLRILGGKK